MPPVYRCPQPFHALAAALWVMSPPAARSGLFAKAMLWGVLGACKYAFAQTRQPPASIAILGPGTQNSHGAPHIDGYLLSRRSDTHRMHDCFVGETGGSMSHWLPDVKQGAIYVTIWSLPAL